MLSLSVPLNPTSAYISFKLKQVSAKQDGHQQAWWRAVGGIQVSWIQELSRQADALTAARPVGKASGYTC